jgi:nitroreductase
MDFYKVLTTRRTVRNFSPQAVPKAILEKILRTAVCAPSGYHAEPWHFVIVQGQPLKKVLSQVHRYALPCASAPVVIAALYDKKKKSPNEFADFLSIAAAVENLLLAARAENLGTCWIWGDERFDALIGQNIRQIIGADDTMESVALIALGYPQVGEQPFVEKEADVKKCVTWREESTKAEGQSAK